LGAALQFISILRFFFPQQLQHQTANFSGPLYEPRNNRVQGLFPVFLKDSVHLLPRSVQL
jgi:hypothetical protein